MISVDEAQKRILAQIILTPTREVPLHELNGKVLREPLKSDRPLPPYDRVAMDGIAIDYSEWQKGQRLFIIEDLQKAGEAQRKLNNVQNCLQVMTGAVLPHGTNTVIQNEHITFTNGVAHINELYTIKQKQNIHFLGSDNKAGDLLVPPFTQMWAPHIAVAASIGKSTVMVSDYPRIAVVSTGDELIDVDKNPLPFQIRKSNPHAILNSLKPFQVDLFHVKDQIQEIFDGLQLILNKYDHLILTGGVSAGAYDFIPQVLADLKVTPIFHKVKQRPGKPFWFGRSEKTLVYALPGNPVSSLVCLYRYVWPALLKSLGLTSLQLKKAYLTKEIGFGKNLTYFLPVQIKSDGLGILHATPVEGNGSGDFSSLAQSDGFIELDESQEIFPAGKAYPYYSWSTSWL